jgi:hypothetical protein
MWISLLSRGGIEGVEYLEACPIAEGFLDNPQSQQKQWLVSLLILTKNERLFPPFCLPLKGSIHHIQSWARWSLKDRRKAAFFRSVGVF